MSFFIFYPYHLSALLTFYELLFVAIKRSEIAVAAIYMLELMNIYLTLAAGIDIVPHGLSCDNVFNVLSPCWQSLAK